MYDFDFASLVIGYIIGVVLCFNTAHLLFVENADDQE